MEISSTNILEQISKKPIQQNTETSQVQKQDNTVSNAILPSIHAAGESLVNTNVPVSYTKTGEVSIPGLEEKASIFKLSNGQKIIIQPKKGPTYIRTTYNVGSLNETEDIRGISHFIEHNLFNGSKGLAPKEYDKRVSDLGGNTNASTSFDSTDYYLSLQLIKDNSLEEAIRLNAMQTQFPLFAEDQLQKEKEPVKSEIDLYKDIPDDVASCLVLKNLFGINTNSSNFILGTKENINSFNREKVMDYYNTWYTPDNAVTVITGDVDVDETINLVSKYFNKQPDLSNINKRHYEPIKYNDKPVRTDIIQPNASSASITMGFAIPEGTSLCDLNKIDTLIDILTSSDSRLSKALDKYGISPGMAKESMQNKPDGAQAILASVSMTEEQIENVMKILYEELTYIANNPPTQQELDNSKNRQISSLKEISESSAGVNSALTSMSLMNNFNYIEDSIKDIQNITVQDISQTARKFLDLNKVSMCVSHEKNATAETINSNYKNTASKAVSFGGTTKLPKESVMEETAKIKQYRLQNNMETMVIPGSGNGKSVLSIDLKTDELNNVSSPAFMVINELLNRGSLYKDNDTYHSILNSKNIGIHFGVGINGLSIGAVFDDENINNSLSLIKEVLSSPNFTQTEFDRAKKLIKDSILSESVSPYDKALRELFPGIKKYASKEERLQQLDALTLNDIQVLYQQILSTAQATATLSAPVDTKPELKDILNNELSYGLPVFRPFSKEKSQSYNIYTPSTEPKILTAVQEQSQAEIIQAYKYKSSENIDDIAKISLLNIILGTGMSSRLFTDLRENEKLAYSVGSDTINEKDTSALILDIGTTTDSPDPNEGSPENVKKALAGFERNVNLLKNENVSQTELDNAKVKYKTNILNYIETNLDKTATFASAKNSPYDIRYFESLLDAIDKITVEDIRSTANYVFQNPPITSIVASQKTFDALNL